MERCIKGNGVSGRQLKRASLLTQMETYMKEDGQATNCVATVSSEKQTGLFFAEIGYIVLSMVKVTRQVSMVPNILEST